MSPKTRQKEFVCSRLGCGKKFSTQSGRSKHYKKCDKQIVAKEKLYETENGKIKCKLCSKPFTSLTNVYKHVKKVHSNTKAKEKKSFTCLECDKVFASQWKVNRHYLTHQKENLICPHCERE